MSSKSFSCFNFHVLCFDSIFNSNLSNNLNYCNSSLPSHLVYCLPHIIYILKIVSRSYFKICISLSDSSTIRLKNKAKQIQNILRWHTRPFVIWLQPVSAYHLIYFSVHLSSLSPLPPTPPLPPPPPLHSPPLPHPFLPLFLKSPYFLHILHSNFIERKLFLNTTYNTVLFLPYTLNRLCPFLCLENAFKTHSNFYHRSVMLKSYLKSYY